MCGWPQTVVDPINSAASRVFDWRDFFAQCESRASAWLQFHFSAVLPGGGTNDRKKNDGVTWFTLGAPELQFISAHLKQHAMRIDTSWVLLLVTSVSCVHGPKTPRVTDHCRPANSWSDNSIAYLQRTVTGTDAGNVKLRTAVKLPYVSSKPAVTLITDESVCAAAVKAVENLYTDSLSRGPVWVFRVGATHYAVSDAPDLIYVFDSSFRWLATLSEVN